MRRHVVRRLACVLLLALALGGCEGSDSGAPAFDAALGARLDTLLAEGSVAWSVPGAVQLVKSPEGARHASLAGVWQVAPETLAPGAPSPRDLSGSALGFLAGPGERPTARAAAALPGPYPGAAMTAGRSFRLCSLTKTFTATLVFMLVDEGRLRLGDTVFDLLGDLVPGSDLITVDMLLTHTSGLYDYARDTAFLALVLGEPDRVWTPRELVDYAAARPPLYPPGEGYNYASTNYILLGMILEAVTGEAWQDLVAGRITGPLGLHIFYPAGPYLPEDASRGYLHLFGLRDVTDIDPSAAWAAGGLAGDASDTLRWLDVLLSGRLLSPASRAAMFTFRPTGVPDLLVGRGVFKERGTLGHAGMVLGYQACMQDLDGWRVVVLSNANPPGTRMWQNAAQDMAFAATDLILGSPGGLAAGPAR